MAVAVHGRIGSSQADALVELDPEQRAIVEFEGGSLRVLGAPGTGKTTALVERALWLVREREVDPSAVLFFVQDRRQAFDLRNAFVRALGRSVAGPSILTFHAFAWSLLTRGFPVVDADGVTPELGFELAGYPAEPVLLTAFDQRALVRKLLAEEDPADWPVNGNLLRSNAFAGEVRDFMLRVQERLHTEQSLRRLAEERGRPDWAELAAFLGRYERKLEDPATFGDGRPRMDFAAVLTHARGRLMGEHEHVVADLKALYPHLLVDDFEEANRAELALLQALLPAPGDGRSAVIAGDPSGSVYAFRGADPRCLFEVEAQEGHLGHVHRRARTPEINLYSHLTDEARGVVSAVRVTGSQGVAWGDIGIIVRDYRNLLAPLRRELNRAGVPHRVEGESLQLAEDPVVRPILFLFSIACRAPGYEELWPALLTSELGGFQAHELVALRRAARLEKVQLHEVCDDGARVDLSRELRVKLDLICNLTARACRWTETLRADQCFWELWNASQWFGTLVELEDDRKLDSLTTLADALARFTERRGPRARMAEFLETLASAEFAPESVRLDRAEDAVTITTAHASKGREFGFAVVAGCVEGQWPDPNRRNLLLDVDLLGKAKDHAERQREALAEEERLFRLATTRATRLVVTGQRAGGSERSSAEPSRFLDAIGGELPETNAVIPDLVLSPREAEVAWRRVLSDASQPPPSRLAALWGVARLEGVDPDRWWWGRAWTENPIPVVADKKTSYTRFSTYENCPLQYLMGQVLGLDPETSYQMAFGSLIHGLLEDVESGKLPKDRDALVAEAEARWRADAYPAGAVAEFLKRDCREIIDRYLRLEADNGHTMLKVEEWFEFDVAGWRVRGKIDRIDQLDGDGLRLMDYKTSNSFKRDSEVADDLQLSTYFLACKRSDNLKQLGEPKTAELVFVRREYQGKINRATMRRPRDAEDGTAWDLVVEERIAQMLGGIEEEQFAPSPQADCRFCKFKPLCPMWPEGEELKV